MMTAMITMLGKMIMVILAMINNDDDAIEWVSNIYT